MPGHKGKCVKNISNAFECDITELSFSDNLATPKTVIKKAQCDLAKLCGAKCSFILTGGSTLGVIAMCYTASKFGNKLIVERSAHKSVFNCLKLFNISPLFFDFENGDFENCEYLKVVDNSVIGALITSPNYFGKSLNLEKISSVLKQKGKFLFVDGAHGGHFTRLNSANYAGRFADIWVDGVHKTMHALTQGALLNLNDLSLEDAVREGLDIFSTSSPSYPIMASVESSVKTLFEYTEKQINSYKSNLNIVLDAIVKRGFLPNIYDDLLKITINTRNENGVKIGEYFESQGVFAELAGENLILFMFSLEFSKQDAQKLAKIILSAPVCEKEFKEIKTVSPKAKLDYLTAVNSKSEWVDLKSANNKICAKNAGLFPPCSPLIIAGEVFNNSVIQALSVQNTFGVVNGKVKVVKE